MKKLIRKSQLGDNTSNYFDENYLTDWVKDGYYQTPSGNVANFLLPQIKINGKLHSNNPIYKLQDGESDDAYMNRMELFLTLDNNFTSNINKAQNTAALNIFNGIKEGAYYIPGIGEVALGADVLGDIINGDYDKAAMTLGTIGGIKLAMPTIVKGLKNFGRSMHPLLKYSPRKMYDPDRNAMMLYDDLNLRLIDYLGQEYKKRYPEATIYDEPVEVTRPRINGKTDSWLITGQMPIHELTKAMGELMKRRLNDEYYGWLGNKSPKLNIIDGKWKVAYPEKAIDDLTNSNIDLYIPTSDAVDAHGFHFGRDKGIRMNPYRKKPYQYTHTHEGLSHSTDDMIIPSHGGVINKKTNGSLRQDYESVSNPRDIFGDDLVNNFRSSGSKMPYEARSMHWEMILKLYRDVAQKLKMTVTELTQLPDKGESLLREMIDERLKTPEDLANFMNLFDSGYTQDWSKLIFDPNASSVAKEVYLRRWKKLLKYAPAAALLSIMTTN